MTLKVTVLMPVYNGEKYLREAVDSILNQTFSDFEFLIIDDGSTDNSWEILKTYNDKRICLVQNENNLGLIASLNIGLELATGDYVARMDADDYSLPNRLKRQVEFMENHSSIGICGTWMQWIGNVEKKISKHPTSHTDIKVSLLFSSTISHNSIIMRNIFLKKYSLRYDPFFSHAEDYEFFVRCSKYFELANIPEVLVNYRIHEKQVSRLYSMKQDKNVQEVRKMQLNLLKVPVTEEELVLHEMIGNMRYEATQTFFNKIELWFLKLIKANKELKLYPEAHFENYFSKFYFHICFNSIKLGIFSWVAIYNNFSSDSHIFKWTDRFKFRMSGIYGVLLSIKRKIVAKILKKRFLILYTLG